MDGLEKTRRRRRLVKHVDDRISALPDSVIHYIFSFLPTQYLVQSSILSKRWRNLWFSTSSLQFDLLDLGILDDIDIPNVGDHFSKFVNNLLLRFDGSLSIQKFSVSCVPRQSAITLDPYYVSSWVLFAVRHNVQIFDFDIYMSSGPKSHYILPSSLFMCESLTYLSLKFTNYQCVRMSTSICLPNLKYLYLHSLVFSQNDEHLIEAFFSGLPSLETLIMKNCWFNFYKYISVNAPQLKHLTLIEGFRGSRNEGETCSIKLSAPNLIYFTLVHIESSSNNTYLLNFPSVLNAFIHVSSDFKPSATLEILGALHNTQIIEVSLGDLCLQNISEQEKLLEESAFSFPQLKSLTLENSITALIPTFLERSPNIESLEVHLDKVNSNRQTIWVKDQVWLFPRMSRLKSVEIQEFQGYKDEEELLQSLLENSVVLEKMIICSSGTGDVLVEKQLKRFGEKLFTFPQASSNLRMMFWSRNKEP